MTKPIYELFVIKHNISANLAMKSMSDSEQKSLWAKEQASREGVGAKTMVVCDSDWADEEHPFWGILQFPDLKAHTQHIRNLRKMGWFDTMDAFTLLGTADFGPEDIKISDPIYKLWVIKNSPAAAQVEGMMPKGLSELRWEKHDALYKEHNSQVMLSCNSIWCNEAYQGFGVSVYPNIEANMAIMQGLGELGWPRFLEGFSLLGTSHEE